jgi:hypothetical protein
MKKYSDDPAAAKVEDLYERIAELNGLPLNTRPS